MRPVRESRSDEEGNLGARVVAAVVVALLVGGLLLMIAIGAAPLDDPDFDRPPLPEESRHRPEASPLPLVVTHEEARLDGGLARGARPVESGHRAWPAA